MTRFINNTKTAMLMAALLALLMFVGSFWNTQGIIIAFLFGAVGNVVAYFFSDKIAIAAMRGQEVDESSAPDLVHMVRRLADNAGLPMPRVYICPQQAPNAFATGRNPKHAAVAVTHGALQLLSYDELEGVMAHELAHVKNRDTLISTVAATIAGMLNMVGWIFFFGGNDREGNPFVAIALMILAPIAAALIQMAISRSREYVADAEGARIAGTPHGLIGALQKLEATAQRQPLHRGQLDSYNSMFIVNPLTGGGMSRLFSTHPSTEDRVARLREVA